MKNTTLFVGMDVHKESISLSVLGGEREARPTVKMRNDAIELKQYFGRLKKEGGDAAAVLEKMKVVSARIKELDKRAGELDAEIQQRLLEIPNLPHESVPKGKVGITFPELLADPVTRSRNLTLTDCRCCRMPL